MNERIQELAEQAWRATSDEVAHLNRIHNRSYSQDEITDIFEIKFAELIVRECADRIENTTFLGDTKEWFEPEDVLWTAAQQVKEHFGVE
jgi:hypothetical protein